MKNLVAAAIRFERPERAAALGELIDVLNEWLADHPELKRTFALWIRTMIVRHSQHRLVLPKVRDLQELKMTLTERFETWAREYEQKGIAQGEALQRARLVLWPLKPGGTQRRPARRSRPGRKKS